MLKSKSSAVLVSCGHSVRAFSIDGTEISVFKDSIYSTSNPTTARWYPNGRLLAVGTSSGVIAFHHHEKLDVIGHFNASSGARSPSAIQCIDVTSGSRFLAAGTESGELNIWDMKSSNIVNRFSVTGPVQSVSFQHTSESRYVACCSGSDVLVFSRASGRLVDSFTVASHTGSYASSSGSPEEESSTSVLHRASSSSRAKVTAVAFSSYSVNLLAVTDDSGCLNVWDVSRTHASRATVATERSSKIGTDATYSRFTSPLRTPATDLAFASATSSAGLFVAGLDKHIRIYDKSLRRFLFSITCAAPVTSIAYCWDDMHIAAGHTTGEITIFKIQFASKSADIAVSLPAAMNELTIDTYSAQSLSVRSLHFQPKDSGISDAQMTSTPKLPKAMQTGEPSDSELDNSSYGKQWRENRGAQRSKTSPAPALMSGMLVPVSERPADDSLIRHNPRDSDIFSPIVRHTQSTRDFSQATPGNPSVVKNLNSEYRRADLLDSNEPRTFPSSVPVVMDRRVSDIIPRTAAASQQYTTFQDTSHVDTSLLDGDAVDTLLGSAQGESFGTSTPLTEQPTHPMASKTLKFDGGEHRTPIRDTDVDGDRGKAATLPRGQTFRRLRKSASEVSPRRQLPPRQPRSNSVTNIKGVADDDVVTETEKIANPMRQFQKPSSEPARALGVEEMEQVPKAVHTTQEKVTEVSTIPPLQRKSGIPNGHDKQLSEINRTVKQTIVAELDALREDLRSDILNIHTELVLSSTRQLLEVEKMFTERDKVIAELQKEVTELRKANSRLQEMYIDE